MLATLADELPAGGDWLYEVKFDGYRALAYVRGGELRAALAQRQRPDGRGSRPSRRRSREAVARDAVARRRGLRARRARPPELLGDAAGLGPARLLRLRLLEADGEPLVDRPLEERRERLRRAARRPQRDRAASRTAFDDGAALLEAVERAGARGSHGQAAGLALRAGPADARLAEAEDARPPGVRRSPATRAARAAAPATFGSLVLAVNEGGELRYAGNVGTGFDEREIARLLGAAAAARAARVAVRRAAEDAARPPRRRHLGRAAARRRGRVQRVDARRPRPPALVQGPPRRQAAAEVRHERPADGRRSRRASASFGSRTSTSSSGRTRGSPRATCSTTTAPSRRCSSRTCAAAVHDAALSRRGVREGVLPEGRAVAHARLDPRPSATEVTTRSTERRRSTVEFPVVDDELALLWMVNMGCIDMNPWYSRVDRPDRPDFVLFDLDPTPEVPWTPDRRGRAAPEGAARRARPRLVPEDLGRQGLPRARPARPPLDLRRHPRVRRARRRRDRARLPEARDDRSGRSRSAAAS